MSANAEDVSVPEAGAVSGATDDAYDLRDDPFDISASKTDAHFALLTRSVSRKRLSPEALAADAADALPADGVPASEPYDDAALSALLLGYQSCPSVAHHPDAFRITRRVRTGNGARDVSRAATGAFARDAVGNLQGASAGQVPHARLASKPEVRTHEVPVLGPAQADATVTVTTAGSVFHTTATSAGYVPSAVPQPCRPHGTQQPYSDLLSGPGFSYAADGNGFFETDTISLGSLCSGSDYGDGYMLGSDYEHEDDDDDTGSSDFRPSRARSAGTVCSGSGERFEAGAAAAGAADAVHGSCGSDDEGAAAAAARLLIDPAVAIAIAEGGGMNSQPTELLMGTEAAEVEEGLVDSPPVRQGSSESVGSADMGDCPATSCASRAALGAAGGPGPAPAAGAGFGVAALVIPFGAANTDFPVAAAAAAAYVAAAVPLPLPSVPPQLPVALAGAAAAPMVPMAPPGGVPGPQFPLGPMVGEASAATAAATALPLTAVATPLLPPEVYLGFVSQLVESVRTATRAVDQASLADRQAGVYGLPGHYAGHVGGGGGAAMWATGAEARDMSAGRVGAGAAGILSPSVSGQQGWGRERGAALGAAGRGAAGA